MIPVAIGRFLANVAGVHRPPPLSINPTMASTIHPGRRPGGKTGAESTNTFCIDGVTELKIWKR